MKEVLPIQKIDAGLSLDAIAEAYPETIPVFVRHGFSMMSDPEKRKTFGSRLSLDIALNMRQMDVNAFIAELEAAIQHGGKHTPRRSDIIRIKGLLPCPVRLPLQEKFDELVARKAAEGIEISGELKAASMGLDWMKDEVEAAATPDELDDIYLSAGFDLFFEHRYFGRFVADGQFNDPTGWNKPNKVFSKAACDILDPQRRYGVLAVVPAVFLVNTTELNGRQVPQSWEDLLHPRWASSISLPVADFDLFNAILLTLRNKYGLEAIDALGRNMQQSLHPAQMVKSDRLKTQRPAVTIMPNFFTKMAKAGGPMVAVWPADGAVISPVFMLAKATDNSNLRDIAAMFTSRETGEVLAHLGLFPSVHPEVDNRLPEGAPFMWLGWDYINTHNLNSEFFTCNQRFTEASNY
ncbi:MAG TPA: ABC transporter substrate-binding protein [Bacteroidales bacterium]|nr:ABC transporter substrate-binding protein [Bacteroidales bacterium]